MEEIERLKSEFGRKEEELNEEIEKLKSKLADKENELGLPAQAGKPLK
jgi:uncharacterized small protein (DUF1192 family)